MKKKFNVEIRTDCKICGGALPNSRYRTYCSDKCRRKYHNKKRSPSATEWNRKRREAIATVPDPKNKCQCLICGLWYVQVGTHIFQVHGLTAREYREQFDLEVKRGTVPEWYREFKGKQALENDTYKNLEKGAKYRFKAGQEGIGDYKRSPITIERLRKNKFKGKKKEE